MHTYHDHLFKLVLIGDTRVGKSKLLQRFADGTYSDNNVPTIGFDFRIKILNVLDKHVKLQIWDTAEQQRYRAGTTNAYGAVYRGVHGIVFCFDVTDAQTFKHTKNYNHEADRMINESCHKVLVATKCDLVSQRQISRERAQTYADSLGISYWETSAKNNTEIAAMFENIAMECTIERQYGNPTSMNLFQRTSNKQYPFKIELNDVEQLDRCYSLVMRNRATRINRKVRDRLEEGLCLILDVKPQMMYTITQAQGISEIIHYFSNYLVCLDVVNRGHKEIFNAITECVDMYKAIKIRSYVAPSFILLCWGYIRAVIDDTISNKIAQLVLKYLGTETIYRDSRLYHNGIASCIEFECDIDDLVMKMFIENAHNEWNQFQVNLKGNHNLQSLTLNINNGVLNNEIFTKILCDICNCIADGVNNLNRLKLCFSGDVIYNTDAKHYRNALHSSIANCYQSVMQEISLHYSNSKHNVVQFFAGNFVSELIKNKVLRVRKMDLDLLPIQWNHSNLMHVHQRVQSLHYLRISGKWFEKHFDMTNDAEIMQLLMERISISHLHTLKLGQFSDKSISFCIPLLSNMLLNNKNVECVELSFDHINIEQIYSLVDAWLNRLGTLYEYYRNITEYMRGLKVFGDSEEVIEIIMEYIRMKPYTLRIDSSSHQLSQKIYLISEFVIEKFIDLLPAAETHNVFECVSDILRHVQMGDPELQLFIDNAQIADNMQTFKDSKIDFLSKLNYMMLCSGFVREISNTNDIYIPHEIFVLIHMHAFYPKFDVWAIGLDQFEELMNTTDGNYTFLPIQWHKLSGLCDEPTIYHYENRFYFKLTEQGRIIWYEIELEEEYKDISISYSTILSELGDKKYDYVSIISEPAFICAGFGLQFMDGLRWMCMNNGDVVNDTSTPAFIHPASLFLLNDKTQMIDIQCSSEHAMFLTSVGNVFCVGANDKGQCGVKHKGCNLDVPVHLKNLSLNVIKKIFIGLDCNFCIDKNDYLYCFGSNEKNKLGLKSFENEIIWEPILHSYFGDKTHLNKVCTSQTMNIFIDKQCQCYLVKQQTQSMYHWQRESMEFKEVKIVDVMIMDEDEWYYIMMFDTANKVTFVFLESDEDPEEKTIYGTKMHGIDENHRIEAIHSLTEGVIIITSPKKH
eukprot:157105_1